MSKVLSPAKYLFDAMLNYLVDANYARILMMVNTDADGVIAHVNDGVINFAIQHGAVKNFIADEEGVSFEAGFGGKPMHCFFPWKSIMGVFPGDTPILGIPNIGDPWGIDAKTAVVKNVSNPDTDKPEPEKPKHKLRLV